MKYLTTLLFATIIFSCNSNFKETNFKPMDDRSIFYLGTYTNGESEGIYKYQISEDGKLDSIGLLAKSDNPSFLALSGDKKYLLACNEIDKFEGNGTVESYKLDGDSNGLLSKSNSGGAHPCFVNIDDLGNVLVANYTGGNVGLMKLNEDGKLSDLLYVQQHEGDSISVRQNKAHAHSAWFIPNTNEVISIDLGTNELLFSKIIYDSSKFTPITQKLHMEDGAGPRHLTTHKKGWIYVVNELNSTVSKVVKNDDGLYELKESISTLPDNFSGESYCADIHISHDGKFLYASNRGHNSIVVFSIDESNGKLNMVSHHSVKGNWPRNFSLTPKEKFLVVANQKSNNMVSFSRDEVTGKLKYIDEISAPTPVCILFK